MVCDLQSGAGPAGRFSSVAGKRASACSSKFFRGVAAREFGVLEFRTSVSGRGMSYFACGDKVILLRVARFSRSLFSPNLSAAQIDRSNVRSEGGRVERALNSLSMRRASASHCPGVLLQIHPPRSLNKRWSEPPAVESAGGQPTGLPTVLLFLICVKALCHV